MDGRNQMEKSLENAQKIAKAKSQKFRPSDFLSKEEKKELEDIKSKPKKKDLYSTADKIIAEIIARFGYETYKAWANDEIGLDEMFRYLLAERDREKQKLLNLERIIISVGSSCITPTKKKATPKGMSLALKILQNEERTNG